MLITVNAGLPKKAEAALQERFCCSQQWTSLMCLSDNAYYQKTAEKPQPITSKM